MEWNIRTKHLSRTNNSFEPRENIAQRRVAQIPELLCDNTGIEKGAKRSLVARRRAQANDPQVLEQHSQLSRRDLVLLLPKIDDVEVSGQPK